MSDSAQGHGWWLASDGRWYPPELWTGPTPVISAPAWTSQPNPNAPMRTPAYELYGYRAQPRDEPAPASRDTNGFAVASLVCSCAGILLLGLPAVAGIVFGFVARSKIRRSNGAERGDGLALAGIIVGFVVVGLVLLTIVVSATRRST